MTKEEQSLREKGLVIDLYETEFNEFEIGPGLVALYLKSRTMQELPFWERWWIRAFRPRLWADTVIKYHVIEQTLRDESRQAWAEGCEIKYADHSEGLTLKIGKAEIGGTC